MLKASFQLILREGKFELVPRQDEKILYFITA